VKEEGNDEVVVNMTKPHIKKADVVDNRDGSYSVFCPYGVDPGKYTVDVAINGGPMNANAAVLLMGELETFFLG